MLRKLTVLFLIMALLPACATMPPAFPTQGPAPQVQKDETALFQEAEANYHRQAYRAAFQQYADYLERYPQGSRAMNARVREAEISGLLGDWQGSLQRYQNILARQPQPEIGFKARYGIGRAYFKLGDYQQATQVLDSLTAAPDLPAVSVVLHPGLDGRDRLETGAGAPGFCPPPPGGPGFSLRRPGVVWGLEDPLAGAGHGAGIGAVGGPLPG